MGLKKLKLSVSSVHKPIDPLAIFAKITLRGSIKNIWDPQAEALRKWHKLRNESDVVIQMNTGGGKTLVGLLIAQSLLNELKRRVVYVVANNQLVEQTLKRAGELGLQPASRYNFNWTREEAFQSAETFCITNYTTVFNGFSTFRDKEVAAFVFDDAHVAETAIRDCFTLRISREDDAFDHIVGLFRPHFANTIGVSKLDDIDAESPTALMFVPMFAIWKHSQELRKLLLESGVITATSTKYVWNHLSNHLNQCCVLISARGIEISPPVVPLHTLPYFGSDVRRTYLTATLPSQASFARTFGLLNPHIVSPGGKSGHAQRLFLFAAGETDEVQRKSTISLIKKQKACVISPSTGKAQQWSPPSIIFDKDSGHEGIEEFAVSDKPKLLGLVARYDGIDLPGEACRILVLDRLPRGESLFDRFMDEGVQTDAVRVGHTATRIVQAIGRIFRSNTDHGAVVLVGSDLHDWIRNPSYRSYLPPLLQKQVALGVELDKKVKTDEVTSHELLQGVLTGDEDWDEIYSDNIDRFPVALGAEGEDWYPEMLLKQRTAYVAVWDGEYSKAIEILDSLSEEANVQDAKLGAWYKHLEGLAHLCADDQTMAFQAFACAASKRVELIKPSQIRDKMFKPPDVEAVGAQARTLAAMYRKKRTKIIQSLTKIEKQLVYGDRTSDAEEAMEMLGTLLGLQSSRHDKEGGPDNLWRGEGEVWGFELKTGKQRTSEYSKTDIAQAHQHAQWVCDHHKGATCRHAIVGYELPVSHVASPPLDLAIIDLASFQDIAATIKNMVNAVEAGNKENLENAFESWLSFHGLLWPNVVLALPSRRAQELKAD